MSSKDAQALFRAAKAQRAGAVKLVCILQSTCFTMRSPLTIAHSPRSKSAPSRPPRPPPTRLHNRPPRHPSLQQALAQHSVRLQTTAAPQNQVRRCGQPSIAHHQSSSCRTGWRATGWVWQQRRRCGATSGSNGHSCPQRRPCRPPRRCVLPHTLMLLHKRLCF